MEQLCELTIEIGGYRKDLEKEIIRVCMVEWAFREDDFFEKPVDHSKNYLLEASALGTLYAGENASDIVQRLEQAVWRANGDKMCHVEVRVMFMNKAGVLDEEVYEAAIA